jgi:hypothetical protein
MPREPKKLKNGWCRGEAPCGKIGETDICSACGKRHVRVAIPTRPVMHLDGGHADLDCALALAQDALDARRLVASEEGAHDARAFYGSSPTAGDPQSPPAGTLFDISPRDEGDPT